MEEQLTSFETAKLAKEKGFNNGSYWLYTYPNNELKKFIAENWNAEQDDLQFEAPTQSLLQKWLREKHNILIFPYINFQGKDYFYCSIFPKNGDRFSTEDFLTYEEALEAGLQDALKLIK